ncbi:PKD domain-containing protein, partial [Ferruginibacter sp. HRS2-29]|uniref:Ig-like domain-containing protein n=1 Tax=Ferruginibacter sp. HRS2-29 TaxID=2487334 RepID=UPI0020CC01C5
MITTTPGGTCSSTIVTRTVVVKDKPNVTLNPFTTICQNQSINPVANVSCYINGATSYVWSFPGGTPATSTAANPGTILYNTPGTYTITLAVSNECGTTTVTRNLAVNPVPVVAVPTSPALCAGDQAGPFTFSSVPAGASFTWTNSNTSIGLAASGTGNIPAFPVSNAGSTPVTAVITVTGSNGLCSAQQSFNITVNPRPNAPVVTAQVSYCLNATASPLTATATGTNTLLWYSVPAGGTGSTTAPVPLTTTAGTTSYYVSQVNTGTTCESVRSRIDVIIRPIPTIGTVIPVNPSTCGSANGSFTITGLAASTSHTVHYLANGNPQTQTINSSTSGTILIGGLSAGSYTNIYVTINGCNSPEIGPVQLTNPAQPTTPVVPAVPQMCSGGTLSLSATSATAGVTYSWTGPSGYTSAQQNPVIPNATVADAGVYQVIVTIAGCASAPTNVNVIVNQTPATPAATSNSPVCTGNSLQLNSGTVTPGGMQYAWTGPNGFTSNLQNPSISNVTSAAAGTYTVIYTSTGPGACVSAAATTTVAINTTPVLTTAVPSNPTACGSNTGSISISGLTAGQVYTVNYTFNTIPQSASYPAGPTGNILITGLSQGTYANINVVLSGCISNSLGPVILADPNPPSAPVASSNSAICSGQTLNLSVSSSAPGAASYTWSGPNGFNSTLQNPSITNTSASNAGYYYVYVTINNCNSLQDSVLVVINPLGALPAVTTPVNYCINTTSVALTAVAAPGGTLNWYNVASGGTPLPSAPVPPTSVAGTTAYYVSQSTAAGCEGSRAQINVVVNPDAKAVFNPVNTIKCAPYLIGNADIGLQVFSANNGAYNWYA